MMTFPKLIKMTEIIAIRLSEERIPLVVIGAMALGSYGIPRFTADIDLLTERRCRAQIMLIMEQLGYKCVQDTDMFAKFDSEQGIYGYVDFMFVSTKEGQDIIKRFIDVKNELLGTFPVVQPSDYIILKFMAIANNRERMAGDESDIISVLKLYRDKKIPDIFEPLDRQRIIRFAERFRQEERMIRIFKNIFGKPVNSPQFFI